MKNKLNFAHHEFNDLDLSLKHFLKLNTYIVFVGLNVSFF